MSSHLAPCIQAFKSEADMSASQYHFVKFGSDDQSIVLAGDGESAIGIVMNSPNEGEDAEVSIADGALIKLSATVARGALIASDATGKGDAGTVADKSIAKCMESGVSGDVVAVVLGLDAVI